MTQDASSPAPAPADDTLRGFYHLHFAGRPRLTRNTELLQQLITMATHNQNQKLAALWRKELQQIELQQQRAGLVGRQIALQEENARFLTQHFYGMRWDAEQFHVAAIDVEALAALQNDIDALQHAAAPLVAQHQPQQHKVSALVRLLEHLAQEVALHRQRTQETTKQLQGDQQLAVLVRKAQLLQHIFHSRFAGTDEVVVRPERLQRLADSLHHHAQALSAFIIDGAEHTENCEKLLAQAASWAAMAAAASHARRQLTLDELAHRLAAAADPILEASEAWVAAGPQSPGFRQQGVALCDRMHEIYCQLQGIPPILGMAEHRHSQGTVADGLSYLIDCLAKD